MLTARKIAQIGTCPGWCCRGGSVGRMGRSGGTAFRGRHRRRIGFSSRYTTNGPQILRRSVAVGWLVGMAASVRLVDPGGQGLGHAAYNSAALPYALGGGNTSCALFLVA